MKVTANRLKEKRKFRLLNVLDDFTRQSLRIGGVTPATKLKNCR